VVLPGTSLPEAVQCVERIRRAVAEGRFACGAEEFRVAMSFGAAEVLAGEEAGGLLRRADMALYAAKNAGRNRSAWHDGGMVRGVETDAPPHPSHHAPPPHPSHPDASRPCDPPAQPPPATPDRPALRAMCTRHEFDQVLSRRMAEWSRGGAAPGVILVRVDHFAAIMARHGPDAGWLVLRSVQHFLGAAVREMDTAVARGEAEFALLMPGVGQADLTRVAERLREAVAQCPLPVGGEQLHFTITAAVAAAAEGDEAAALMRRAEEALASGVQAGGNRTFYHDGRRSAPAAG